MGKVIFWIVVVFAVLFGLRLLNAGKAKRRARDADRAEETGRAKGEAMVRCTRCGVFVPQADALPAPGGYVCGDPGCRVRR